MPKLDLTKTTPEPVRPEGANPNAPSISLPKGGGAIRGIGEKFAANPVTGTGSMTVPIATSAGRSGFGPQLALSYNSGSGNGPFGLGWSLGLPQITRKTDKGLPRYNDAGESDIFILSGAEDLVPVLVKEGEVWERESLPPRNVGGVAYRIQRYRPRIEGLFARIERWTSTENTADCFWRTISKDNTTTWYGKTQESRIADPEDKSRIFSWLICETHDDKGNVIAYHYKREDSLEVDITQAHERNRTNKADSAHSRSVNSYLKCIRYGNHVPYFPVLEPGSAWPAPPGDGHWFFEILFDYGEHDAQSPKPSDSGPWSCRHDPFSSYRAGFEIRTYRLCQRVLMFHHFPHEPDVSNDCLVRSTDFIYSSEERASGARKPIYSLLTSVGQSGYKRKEAGYLRKSLPPLEFTYSEATIESEIHEIDSQSLENLPVGLAGSAYQWVDLDGEGISGTLTEQADGWFYKRNLSPASIVRSHGIERAEGRLAPVEHVATKPAVALAFGRGQFLDLAGDGRLDVVTLRGPLSGYYERTENETWEPFRHFQSLPNEDWDNPNLRFIDLTGDGHADILISRDEVFCWHPSLGEAGFGPQELAHQASDEEKGPRLLLDDGTLSIYLADMSGDGLTDLVRIRNDEVCYWPNLGYCRFGAKVTLDNSPLFDHAEKYDGKSIRLADVDGSGTTDIIYISDKQIAIYRNESGNALSDPEYLSHFPRADNLSSVQTLDLLGNGTACLVWSSSLPGDAQRSMRYVDLMGGQKPHLLVKNANNLGAETSIYYAPSTKFYLQDKLAGNPWITRLPFPVHVIERIETSDRISGNRFVTRYVYHHGYFDGHEREFRGFGMVEQFDSEEIASTADEQIAAATNFDATSFVPPIYTKTWFHTGVHLCRQRVSDFFAGLLDEHDSGDYYREPGQADDQARALLLDDTVLPPGLTADDERDACRALKGAMLHQEVYSHDAPKAASEELIGRAQTPYMVTEQNFTIRCLQPRHGNQHAVFLTHAREAISYRYERNPTDPRISHAMTLEVDDFGDVLKSVTIGYGRRLDSLDPIFKAEDRERQKLIHITCTQSIFTNAVDTTNAYRAPLIAETKTYELRKTVQEQTGNGPTVLYRFDDILRHTQQTADGKHDIDYEDLDFSKAKAAVAADPAEAGHYFRRLIEHVRTAYRKDNLTALLELGKLESRALPGQNYELTFSPGLLAQVYRRKLGTGPEENLLPDPTQVLAGSGSDRGGFRSSQDLRGQGIFPANSSQPLWTRSDADGHWWTPSDLAFFSPNPSDDAGAEFSFARKHFFLSHRFHDAFGHMSILTYDSNDANPQKNYNLLLVRAEDALGNIVTATNDYRVIQPQRMIDPNGNRTEVAFDAMGLVVATAVRGKNSENRGDLLEDFDADLTLASLQSFVSNPRTQAGSLLGKATTRIVYDLDRFQRGGQPPFAGSLTRETHFFDPGGPQTKIQINFSYSDGFGREIQRKIQAEAGNAPQRQAHVVQPNGDIRPGELVRDANGQIVQADTPQRWIGTGRIVFNNKGRPVKHYEPFFSATHLFEDEREMTDTGVTSILFYDPLERLVARLHPNHTWEKVTISPWQQATHDVNDTVLTPDGTTDPKLDRDVGGFFVRLPATNYLPTWYQQRIALAASDPERLGAEKTALHRQTPSIAHFDAVGRPFLSVAHNRFERGGVIIEEKYPTRVELDVEGNQRTVRDAIVQNGDHLGRIVMHYDYDMLGNRIHQTSMEAGQRWMLNDVAGNPIRLWDSRGFVRRLTYDELRRPTNLFVTENATERLAERTIYGETLGDTGNHRTRVHRIFDGAGVVTNEAYDFKGNLVDSRRDLLPRSKQTVDWQLNPIPNDGTFSTRTTYDAFDRPLTITSPDNSVYRPTFNEANMLESLSVHLRGAATPTPFVTNINYNAKGQRELIAYGNGARTQYEYDPTTFRLIRLRTKRPSTLNGLASQLFAEPTIVQDLRYTYDPIGNITHIEDAALQTIFFDNQEVAPICAYIYDAVYKLIEATGREHIGQTARDLHPPDANRRDYPFVGWRAQPTDMQALRNYTERYHYDAVGNFLLTRHIANSGSWTRAYEYRAASLIEPHKQSNRLTKATLGNGTSETESYTYSDALENDVHGCMTSISDAQMTWNFKDQLQQIDLRGGGTAYYVYDAAGQRVRKVWEKSASMVEERIYVGAFEIFRRLNVGSVSLERETLHIIDDKQRIGLVETRILDSGGSDPAPQQLIRYQFGNHLGSASLELDHQAQVVSYEEYMPFGSTSFQAVRDQTETPKRYRYTGKERDEESGLNYHGARYYVPWLGRWTACDPTDLADGLNLYAYVRNNPIRLTDRTGAAGDPPSSEEIASWKAKNPERTAQIMGSPMTDEAKAQMIFKEIEASRKTQVVNADPENCRPLMVAPPPKPSSITQSAKVTPKDQQIEGRIISFPHESGVGANNRYVRGNKEELDRIQHEQAMKARDIQIHDAAAALAGVQEGKGRSPAIKQDGHQPRAGATKPGIKRSQMNVGEIDKKIAEVNKERVDQRNIAEDFLSITLPKGPTGRLRKPRTSLDEPLSTGKMTEDLDQIIAEGSSPNATDTQKQNAKTAEAIKGGFKETEKQLNDLARERRDTARGGR